MWSLRGRSCLCNWLRSRINHMQHDWRRLFWLCLNRSLRMLRAVVWIGRRGARLTLWMMRRGAEQRMLSWLHSRTGCWGLRCEFITHRSVLVLHLNVIRIANVEMRSVVRLRTPREVG